MLHQLGEPKKIVSYASMCSILFLVVVGNRPEFPFWPVPQLRCMKQDRESRAEFHAQFHPLFDESVEQRVFPERE